MTHTYAAYKRHLRTKDLHRLKVKGWKQIFQANGQEKKAGVAILISYKIDFKKKGHKERPRRSLHNTQRKIHEEDMNIVNIYAPKIGAPEYIKKILENFKKDSDSNTIIVGDFNTALSKMDRSSNKIKTKILWY